MNNTNTNNNDNLVKKFSKIILINEKKMIRERDLIEMCSNLENFNDNQENEENYDPGVISAFGVCRKFVNKVLRGKLRKYRNYSLMVERSTNER